MANHSIDKETDAQSIQILEVAWRRYAQLDLRASSLEKSSLRSGLWIAFLGILFVGLAIVFDIYGEMLTGSTELVVKALLVITPILSALLAAYSRKSGVEERVVLRGGANDVLKDIYIYRTILVSSSQRRDWLGSRLVAVQRQLSDALKRELSLQPYNDQVPPGYSPDNLASDPGFTDLSWGEYLDFRIENRLAWYIQQNQSFQGRRTRLVLAILLAGGAGAFLAALGGPLTIWCGIIASVTFAQYGWNELRKLEKSIQLDNKVIADLMVLYERWNETPKEDRNQLTFFNLIQSTEQVIWERHTDYVQSVHQVLLTMDNDLLVWSALLGETEPIKQLKVTELELDRVEPLETDVIAPEILETEDLDEAYSVPEEDGDGEPTPDLAPPLDDYSSNDTDDIDSIHAVGLALNGKEAEDLLSVRSEDTSSNIEVGEDSTQVMADKNDVGARIIGEAELLEKSPDEIRTTIEATLEVVADEYSDTAFNRSTPAAIINDVLNRFQPFEQSDSSS